MIDKEEQQATEAEKTASTINTDNSESKKDNSVEVGKTISDIGNKLIADMPEITTEPGAMPEPLEDKKDRQGRSFDADIHAVDSAGNPILTAKGTLKMKKRGRPAKIGNSNLNLEGIGGNSLNSGSGEESIQKVGADSEAAAIAASGAVIALGVGCFGEEWLPDEESGEDKSLRYAFQGYFEAKNIQDFPPGVALAIALSMYALPRLTKPKTRAKTLSWWGKMKLWYKARKLKKEYDATDEEIKPIKAREENSH